MQRAHLVAGRAGRPLLSWAGLGCCWLPSSGMVIVNGKQGCSWVFQRDFGKFLARLPGEFESILGCSLVHRHCGAEKK